VDVEPSLADITERALNDLLKATYPTLLAGVELNLGNAGGLDLFEFFDTQSLSFNRHIIDVVIKEQLVAFSSDFNHGLDDFLLDEEGVEAEI
jgi:hypothetical protein